MGLGPKPASTAYTANWGQNQHLQCILPTGAKTSIYNIYCQLGPKPASTMYIANWGQNQHLQHIWPLVSNQHSVYYGHWDPSSILSTMATGAQPAFCLLWPLVLNQHSVYYGHWSRT